MVKYINFEPDCRVHLASGKLNVWLKSDKEASPFGS